MGQETRIFVVVLSTDSPPRPGDQTCDLQWWGNIDYLVMCLFMISLDIV